MKCGFKWSRGFRPAGTQANERLIAGMREALSEQERTQKEQEDALEDRGREIETLTQGDKSSSVPTLTNPLVDCTGGIQCICVLMLFWVFRADEPEQWLPPEDPCCS